MIIFSDQKSAEHGRMNLHDTALVLEKSQATWWIEAGTLLGCVREKGKLIGHDSDIDFGILGDEKLPEIKSLMVGLGFTVHHSFGIEGRGREISFKRDGIKVDVFCFYRDGEKLWHGAWREDRMIRLEFHKDTILPTRITVMENKIVNRPRLPEEYLTIRYGWDWRTPKSKWRWDRDPKCINWKLSDWSLSELEEKYPWPV